MLDAYIIERIRQEELERQQRFEEGRRIWLDLPLPEQEPQKNENEEQGGPIIIPLYRDEVEDDAA